MVDLTPEDRAKVYPFSVYRRLRKLGTYVPQHYSRGQQDDLLQARKKRVAQLEAEFPDFKEVYARVEKGFL